MTYKKFKKVILDLKKQDQIILDLSKMGLDLFNFVDPYQSCVSDLIKEIYGDIGHDWWSWFCYENNYGKGNLKAWDYDGTPICYDLKSLWEYLEKTKKIGEC